jgi:ubiquinone/menaquinone biosynthesis C-methylase UbiE
MADQDLPAFGNMAYWDDGYKRGDAPSEWFLPYKTFSKFVHKHCPPDQSVLVLGCGTSGLTMEMLNEGYADIQSMDYSPEAIEQMRRRRPDLRWHAMDVRAMTFESGTFHTIVDKGTLDCLFFLDETNDAVIQMLTEVCRVLRPGGRYIVVTCGHPMQRMDIFTRNEFGWTVTDWKEYQPPEASFTHASAYVYCITKNAE